MSVISFARQLAAMGDEISFELSKLTNIQVINKEYIEKLMEGMGISQKTRAKFDEKKPGLWASLSQERDDYLHCLKTVLYETASKGSCIISGRGAGSIFAGVPGAISIKLVAPMEIRIQRTMAHFQCSQKRAEQILKQSDSDRKGFHDYFFNLAWNCPGNYDLTINTGNISPQKTAEIIYEARKILVSPEDEEAGNKRIKELVLGQKIITEIVYTHKLPIHFLEVDVHDNTLLLHGVVSAQGTTEEAIRLASSLAPGFEIKSAVQIVQEYPIIP